MGKFTVLDDPAADAAIQTSLNRVVEAILELIGNKVKAIILTGGFGRGEGGVIKENGKYRPVNDFDITLIASKYYFHLKKQYRSLVEVVNELADEIGVKQVDIGISYPLRMKFSPNLVLYYELRNGHQVLWGDINLKRIMPELPAHDLPLLDGAIYFLSRGSGLLIPALYFLPEGNIEKEHRENFQIEIDKACMAMGDAFLLLQRQYHWSYRERLRKIDNIDMTQAPKYEAVKSRYKEAVKRKLRPRFSWPGDKPMIDRWFQVVNIYNQFFLWFESMRLGKEFSNWKEYSNYVSEKRQDSVLNCVVRGFRDAVHRGLLSFWTKERRVERFRKSRTFQLAVMPTLLFSLKRESINYELLNRGQRLLGLPETNSNLPAWQEATKNYLSSFHPEGVVKELINEREDA